MAVIYFGNFIWEINNINDGFIYGQTHGGHQRPIIERFKFLVSIVDKNDLS
jgi:hypothetical protein